MRVSLIAAMARNRVIGRENDLPWKLPADQKRFKQITMGHYLIMGRKTYDSVGKPLPGRPNVVITRRKDYRPEGVQVVHSLNEALALAVDDDEVFIAGGEEIYRLALPVADCLYLTEIDAEFEGDTFFPDFDRSQWEVVAEEVHTGDDRRPFSYSYRTYRRKVQPQP